MGRKGCAGAQPVYAGIQSSIEGFLGSWRKGMAQSQQNGPGLKQGTFFLTVQSIDVKRRFPLRPDNTLFLGGREMRRQRMSDLNLVEVIEHSQKSKCMCAYRKGLFSPYEGNTQIAPAIQNLIMNCLHLIMPIHSFKSLHHSINFSSNLLPEPFPRSRLLGVAPFHACCALDKCWLQYSSSRTLLEVYPPIGFLEL